EQLDLGLVDAIEREEFASQQPRAAALRFDRDALALQPPHGRALRLGTTEEPERFERDGPQREEVRRLDRIGEPVLDECNADTGTWTPQSREILDGACRRHESHVDAGSPQDLAIACTELRERAAIRAGRHDDGARWKRVPERDE